MNTQSYLQECLQRMLIAQHGVSATRKQIFDPFIDVLKNQTNSSNTSCTIVNFVVNEFYETTFEERKILQLLEMALKQTGKEIKDHFDCLDRIVLPIQDYLKVIYNISDARFIASNIKLGTFPDTWKDHAVTPRKINAAKI